MFVLSSDIVTLYTSGKYIESIIPLKYFSIVIFLNAIVHIQREGILYIFEKEKKIIKYNLIGGIINILLNVILYFLGLFNPVTAIITLGISFLFLSVVMRIFVRNAVNKDIILIDRNIIKYIVISLIVVLINYGFGIIVGNLLIKFIMVFITFGVLYLLGLIITKDHILLMNYRIIKNALIKYKDKMRK